MITHRSRLHLLDVFLVLLAVVVLTCDSSDPPASAGAKVNETVEFGRENAEAELAALWLSGELTAPKALYQTIKDDLSDIRAAYTDSIAELEIEFVPPWEPSQVLVGFTESGVERLRAGDYPEFDELNDLFHLAELDTKFHWHSPLAILTFEGRQHPARIAAPYESFDDVRYAEPNGFVGDWGNVYPWWLDEGISYLWRDAWGDCPAGCINSRFWYFRVTDAGIEYVGTFEKWVDPEPPWWGEAKAAYFRYRTGHYE